VRQSEPWIKVGRLTYVSLVQEHRQYRSLETPYKQTSAVNKFRMSHSPAQSRQALYPARTIGSNTTFLCPLLFAHKPPCSDFVTKLRQLSRLDGFL